MIGNRQVVLVLALLAASTAACKDAGLGPSGSGWIEGLVLHAETGEPMAGASITSTPPSDALVSDAAGRFVIDELTAGNYQITARKAGYQQSTVSVAVRPDRAASATMFLQEQDDGARYASLEVEVLNMWNTIQADSTFAEAEFQVRNTGEISVSEYDVDFVIATTQGDRYHQERGESLRVGQSDIRRFRVYIQTAQATSVTVQSVWSDPPQAPSD